MRWRWRLQLQKLKAKGSNDQRLKGQDQERLLLLHCAGHRTLRGYGQHTQEATYSCRSLRGEQTTVEEQVRIEKFIDSDEVEGEQWNDDFEIIPGLDSRAVAEGKRQELDLCEQWDIYEPVALEEGMTLEDCKWVLRVEPNYSVRARLLARQYKWREHREDLFAPSSTSNTSRIIDYIAVKKGYATCTADATRAFFKCLKRSCVM